MGVAGIVGATDGIGVGVGPIGVGVAPIGAVGVGAGVLPPLHNWSASAFAA